MEKLITQYKETKSEIENLESHLATVRAAIMAACGNDEYQGFGLTISKVTPEPTLDWKTAVKVLNIKQEKLTPFFKERPSYFKFTVKRSIEI